MGGTDEGGWLRISLECPGEVAEGIEEALVAAGAIAITLEDAGEELRLESWPPERPLWRAVRVSGLFARDGDGLERVAALVPPGVLDTLRAGELPDTDWVRAGRERVGPMRFGDRLWVVPTWAEPPPEAAPGVVVRLDPGLAFGTGAHPSTRLCLRRLAAMDLAGRTVIDYGCGSGILGIAAIALGASRCVAVDIDPQALESARENADHNRIIDVFDIMSPQAVDDAIRGADFAMSDVLVANVLAGPLAALAGTFRELVGHGGDLILSGILANQADALVEAYAPWFGLSIAASEDEWILLAGPRVR